MINNMNMFNINQNNMNFTNTLLYDSSYNMINNSSINNKIQENIIDNKIIPKIEDFNNLYNKKYTLVNLKLICKHYKIKSSGTKQELLERIYSFLKKTYYAIKIQRITKLYLIKKLNIYKGPALIKRSMCVNDTDFMSMDPINDISYYQFISYKDIDNYVYGFDIISLYNWLSTSIKDNKDIVNPYNRNKLPTELIKNLRMAIKLSKTLKFNINVNIENDNKSIKLHQINNNKVIQLFQNIDELGFYTDVSWFNDLNYYSLIRYIKELYDIWTYRAQLTNETKYRICQNVNPFINYIYIINHNIHINPRIDINILKNSILFIIDRLINYGTTREYKYLGASYVLAALTLVNRNVADAIPWLYHSVA